MLAYSLLNFNLLECHIVQFYTGFKKCFFCFQDIYFSPNSMRQAENVRMNLLFTSDA